MELIDLIDYKAFYSILSQAISIRKAFVYLAKHAVVRKACKDGIMFGLHVPL